MFKLTGRFLSKIIDMNTLKIENLTLQYNNGLKAIDKVSLEIQNGMFGLLGPNGAGKSSLMKTIVGLQKPTSGSILFNDVDIVKNPEFIKKNVGFLPQDFGVYPKTSALQLLNHLAILKGVSNSNERQQQVLQLLEKVNLTDFRNKEVHTFSGGMKQRFGVAQALLGNPKIIIVDEPTAGLDPEEKNRFNSILSEISEDIIVLLSTHLVEDVKNLCSNLAVMNKGNLKFFGSPGKMVETLKNKTWSKNIQKNELAFYKENCNVISEQLIERKLQITIVGENPPEGFSSVEPTLEHFYFNTIKIF